MDTKHLPDKLLWLAYEMNDRTIGNTTINLDWGNHTITCSSTQLKNLLVELIQDYIRLRGEQ